MNVKRPFNNETNPAEKYTYPNVFEDWVESDYSPSAKQTGSPCNRYVVRQPDGHRDVDGHEDGTYEFSAFGFRNKIGGEFKSLQSPDTFYGQPILAYCPDFSKPYATDLFGVTVPGIFNFELLDYYQQKLSLIGAAHLHMHMPDSSGAGVMAFNEDGGLRYIEMRLGDARHHDLIFQDAEKTVIKIGSQYAAKRQRDNREIFNVPRWSFIENTSLWIEMNDDVDGCFEFEEIVEPGVGRVPMPQLEHFSNRLIAHTLKINRNTKGSIHLDADGSIVQADDTPAQVSVHWENGNIEVIATGVNERGISTVTHTYSVPAGAFERYAASIPNVLSLKVDDTRAPDPELLIEFAKAAYMKGHRILSGRDSIAKNLSF